MGFTTYVEVKCVTTVGQSAGLLGKNKAGLQELCLWLNVMLQLVEVLGNLPGLKAESNSPVW